MRVLVLAEVAEVLARSGHLRCDLAIDDDGDDGLLIQISVPLQGSFAVMELREALQWVADVAAVRAFAERYGIDPARVEAILPRREE